MPYNLLSGKEVSKSLKQNIKEEVQLLSDSKRKPHLVAILVGHDSASETYVASKMRMCKQVGFLSTTLALDESTTEDDLIAHIQRLNQDERVDGFIVQQPLPKHIDSQKVLLQMDPKKDVDGFHPYSIGAMTLGLETYPPATPMGILSLLEYYNIQTSGKHCVVLGRSNIVGTPMSILMSRNTKFANCTVTLCHSATKNLSDITKLADIIIVAIGKRGFLKADMVQEGAVVIDVGIHRVGTKNDKAVLEGDVDFEEVAPKCSYITPVPGGVGPMTVTSLIQNTLSAYKKYVL